MLLAFAFFRSGFLGSGFLCETFSLQLTSLMWVSSEPSSLRHVFFVGLVSGSFLCRLLLGNMLLFLHTTLLRSSSFSCCGFLTSRLRHHSFLYWRPSLAQVSLLHALVQQVLVRRVLLAFVSSATSIAAYSVAIGVPQDAGQLIGLAPDFLPHENRQLNAQIGDYWTADPPQNRFEQVHAEFGGKNRYKTAKPEATRANCPGPAGDMVVKETLG